MKTFFISIPFAGTFSGNVDAETEEEAIRLFKEKAGNIQLDNDQINESGLEAEWDLYEKIVEGNVCHLYNYEMTIEEVEPDTAEQ